MSIFSSRLPTILLFFSLFHLEGVFGRGGGGGSGSGDGPDVSLDLSLTPEVEAVFALRIVIAIITLFQLGYSLKRFKSLHLPEGEPILRYDTGMLFRILLTSYTVIYILYNSLYAVSTASRGGNFHLPLAFFPGTNFTGQLVAIVLFYATLLSIVAYRQRLQLNPAKNILNLKTFLDGTLLVTILALGIAQDAVPGTGLNPNDPEDQKRIVILRNLIVAFQVFVSLASLNVAVSSFMARARLSKANIRDRIINICAFQCCQPDSHGLLIAAVVILGIVSIATVHFCLLMGAPPKPPKSDKGAASEKKV
ncbi:hypothetical protein AGABI2DRAFT_143390 [Agaricus bisporus var. bisporus H97]|uniref:hypothetical protein n=1 Tax=Agaricus bisporus var. bisporus (strain H97 / ATCC MYA-4626 / FGSC 10389) TaxID=936046 RepID=UPI00029F629F|nr:hypothetical protein AGABI2DRAFT_143390 [Agaricus bisporus var. bisporus H97]EKV46210.1 hypothetical protein AGABI2DRAFT_143390 [Agaricus bisporus var. bisporus H97]